MYVVNILCFCDNGTAGNTDEATGLKIIKMKERHDITDNSAILACVGDEKACQSICRQMLSLGFDGDSSKKFAEQDGLKGCRKIIQA